MRVGRLAEREALADLRSEFACGREHEDAGTLRSERSGIRGETLQDGLARRAARQIQPEILPVRDDGFEYQGRPYKSLSAAARAITGTRWNGLVFFGLKSQRGAA